MTRMLLFVGLAGDVTRPQIVKTLSLLKVQSTDRTTQKYIAAGLLRRDPEPKPGGGLVHRIRLDERFFAYAELRALIYRLIETLHPEIRGYVSALGKPVSPTGEILRG